MTATATNEAATTPLGAPAGPADSIERTPRAYVVVLVVVTLLAAAVRVAFVAQPMRYDEAVTYSAYVRPAGASPLAVVRQYSANNHLFHTLLVWLSTRAFGGGEVAIRLPTLLAAIAVVPAAYLAFTRLMDRETGLIAAALAAGSAPLVLYAVNARGYAMVTLLTLVCLWLAARVRDTNRPRDWIILSVLVALGFWTIPVMAYPATAVFLYLAITGSRRRAFYVRLSAYAVASVTLALLLYLPTVISVGAHEVTDNKWVSAREPAQFLQDLRAAPAPVARSWTSGLPPAAGAFLHALALAGVALTLVRRRVPILLVALLAATLVLVATRRVPPARVWLWLLPIYLASASAAITAAPGIKRIVPYLSITLASLLSWRVWSSASPRHALDTGRFTDAPAVAELLARHVRPTDRVIAASPADAPLEYYLARRGIDGSVFRTPAPRRVFIVLGKWENADFEFERTPQELLFTRRLPAERFKPPERIGKFDGADVYATSRAAPATSAATRSNEVR